MAKLQIERSICEQFPPLFEKELEEYLSTLYRILSQLADHKLSLLHPGGV